MTRPTPLFYRASPRLLIWRADLGVSMRRLVTGTTSSIGLSTDSDESPPYRALTLVNDGTLAAVTTDARSGPNQR